MTNSNQVWPTANIFSWQNWITNCWEQCADQQGELRIVLSPWQRQLAFSQVIQTDVQRQPQHFLWNQTASIKQALKAWRVCHDYELEPANWKHVNDDVAVFKRWFERYELVLQQNNWLDSAQLINILVMQNYRPDFGKLIVLEQNFTPNQQKWLTHLQAKKESLIEFFQAAREQRLNTTVSVFDNFEQEIKACAGWARKKHEQNPNTTIGIVVPGLKNCSKTVGTVFRSIFTPQFDLTDNESELFSLSVTQPIKHTGVVSSAMSALELLLSRFDYDCFSLFLRAQYFKDRSEYRYCYSLLDIELRRHSQSDQSLNKLIRLIERTADINTHAVSELINRLEKLKSLVDSFPVSASSTFWCDSFSTALNILGWPDIPNLDLKEQQLIKQWHQSLALMCTSGLISERLSLAQALAQLNEITAITSIQSDSQATVKIIDLDDIFQARFDSVWVTGLNDCVLPEETQLNPLLPFGLQRQCELPFSTSQSNLKHAQLVFTEMTNLADEVRFSYFKSDELSNFRVSPVIADLDQQEIDAANTIEFHRSSDLLLDGYEDDAGLPLELDSMVGGTYLLKAQSACPFQSYAAHRLQADPLDKQQPGLDAAEKGILTHDVLRRVWRELGSQRQLLTLTKEQSKQLVDRHIDTGLLRLNQGQQLFCVIEKQRLSELILNWLEYERLRKQSFKVIRQEHKSSFNAGPLNLEIKIDRIDEFEDGSKLIIDYKTGYAESNQWIRDLDRIEDPQLPIYFLAQAEDCNGLAIANLKEMKFDGLADGDLGIKGIIDINNNNKRYLKENQINRLSQLANQWQTSVNFLAQEYLDGFARVSPRDPTSQCKYCQRQSLCRIYDQQRKPSENEAAG